MKNKVEKSVQLINRIHFQIAKQSVFESQSKMILAISGGQDSISLFFIVFHLIKLWKGQVVFLWCNHLWQCEAFDTMYHLWKFNYYLNRSFIFSIAITSPLSEEKSRKWREKLFQRSALFANLKTILTGHTATDSIETILFNLIRGTSIEGLNSLNQRKPLDGHHCFGSVSSDLVAEQFQAIKVTFFWKKDQFGTKQQHGSFLTLAIFFQRNFFQSFQSYCFIENREIFPVKLFDCKKIQSNQIQLVRPLLSLNRYDSKQLTKFFQLPLYPDPTNRAVSYTRNRIRKQFLPFVRFFFNSQVDATLIQFNQTNFEDQIYFNQILNRLFSYQIVATGSRIEIDISVLYSVPFSIRKRCIRYLFKKGFGFSPHFYHINFLSNFIDNRNFENHIIKISSFFQQPKSWYLFLPQVGCLVITQNKLILYK